MMRRPDFFKISSELQYDAKSCKQLTLVHSDHSPIVLKMYLYEYSKL